LLDSASRAVLLAASFTGRFSASLAQRPTNIETSPVSVSKNGKNIRKRGEENRAFVG
jgi:hypothetical protein